MANTIYVGADQAYTTLQDAVNAAQSGDTIVLTGDLTAEEQVSIKDIAITVDLANNTFTGRIAISGNADATFQNGNMTVDGTTASNTTASKGVINVSGNASLTLDTVKLDGGESKDMYNVYDTIFFQSNVSTASLNIINSTVIGGTMTRTIDSTWTGSATAGKAITVSDGSDYYESGAVYISNSTIIGGYGKSEAVWEGYNPKLMVAGGDALYLGGRRKVEITNSTISGGNSDFYNAGIAVNTNSRVKKLTTITITSSTINGGDSLGKAAGRGNGAEAIQVANATFAGLTIIDSTVSGGDGGYEANGVAIESNAATPIIIKNSVLEAGQGENAGTKGVFELTNKALITLDDVEIYAGSSESDPVMYRANSLITLSGPVEITGGVLNSAKITIDASGVDGTMQLIYGPMVEEKITIAGVINNDNAQAFFDGGVLYVSTMTEPDDMSKFYVNADWAGLEDGKIIALDKIIGVNAFASFEDALKVVDSRTSNIEIIGNLVETVSDDAFEVTLSQDLTITGNVIWQKAEENPMLFSAAVVPNGILFKTAAGVESVKVNFTNFNLSKADDSVKSIIFGSGINVVIDEDSTIVLDSLIAEEGSNLNIAAGASFTVGDLDVDDITLDEKSKIEITNSFKNSGEITINLSKDFTGSTTLVELADGATADYGQINVNGKNVITLESSNGNLEAYKLDANTIYVNSDWSGIADAEELAPGLTKGVNAFDDFRDALVIANNKKGANIVFADEEYAWKSLEQSDAQRAVITAAGTYNISGGNGLLWNYEFEVNPEKSAGKYIVNFNDAYFTCGKITLRSNAVVTINNSTIDYLAETSLGGAPVLYYDGTNYLSVFKNSSLTVNNSKIGYTPQDERFGTIFQIYGTAKFNDSELYAYVSSAAENGFGAYGNGSITVNDSDLYCSIINVGTAYAEKYLADGTDTSKLMASLTISGSEVYNTVYKGDNNDVSKIIVGSADGINAGKVVITDGSVVDFRKTFAETAILDIRNDKSSVKIDGASSLDIAKISNAGTLEVAGATLTTDTLTNNGTVNVSGTSTLNIGTVTGDGVIDIAAGTKLVDTNITSGNIKLNAGVLNFYGANTLTTSGTFDAAENADIVVNKGASLLLNRGGYSFAGGRDITVYGLIEDATAMTSADLADTILSLKANSTSGFSLTYGNSNVTVNDAYIELGNTSLKTSSAATHTWKLTNSYIKASCFGSTNNVGDASKWTITADDSRIDASNYIKAGKGLTFNFINGTVATAVSLRVDGELNIMSGSSVSISSYQNNAVGARDEHGDISGKLVIDDATLDIKSNATTIVELLGGEVSVQNNGELLLNTHNMTLDADAELKVVGGGKLTTAGYITNNGIVTVGGGSLLTVDSFTNNGKVYVDVTGFSGVAKVIDITGDGAAVKAELAGNNSKAELITYGNDIYVAAVDKSSILLDAAASADKFNENIDSYIVGVNAFDNAAAAIGAMNANTKTIYVNGTVNGGWVGQGWEGEKTFDYALNFQKADKNSTENAVINAAVNAENYSYRFAKDLTIGAGVTLQTYDCYNRKTQYDNFIDFAPAGKSVTVTVDGTFIYSAGNFGAGAKVFKDENDLIGLYVADKSKKVYVNVNEGGKMFATGESNNTFFENSVLTVKGDGKDNLQFSAGTYAQFGGKVTFENTCVRVWGSSINTLPSEYNWMGMKQYTFVGDEKFVAKNTRLEFVDGVVSYGNADITANTSAGLDTTPFDALNRNMVYFDKVSELTNTDIYAGDMYVMGKSVSMNGGILDLASDKTQTDNVHSNLAGKLEIADGAAMKFGNGTITVNSIVNNGKFNLYGNVDFTNAVSISGNAVQVAKGAQIALMVDDAFNGGIIMLDVYDASNIKSVNGADVIGNAVAGYSVKVGDVIYVLVDKNSNGLSFEKLTDANGVSIIRNYTGTLDIFTKEYTIEAKEGTANLTVSKNKEIRLAGITKNANGGVTNLNVKDKASLTLGTLDEHSSIEAVGKITTGNGAEIKLGEVSGTNLNSTINLGKNNFAVFDNIDLKGGKNTLSIGAKSDVEVADSDDNNANGFIKNVRTIKLASGSFDKKTGKVDETTLNVVGDIVAPAMKNSITLGNYAKLTAKNLVNDDINVGTTIKAGKNSIVTFNGDVTSAAGIKMGANSSFIANDVFGTAGNDKFNFGAGMKEVTMNSVDMKDGKNTFFVGANTKVVIAENLSNVSTLKLAKGAAIDIDGILEGTAKNDTITFANDAAYSEINGITLDNGDKLGITLGDGNDKLAIGNNVVFNVGGNIIFGEAADGKDKDTLTLGKGAELTTTGIEGVETINAAKGAVMVINNGVADVDFDEIKGSWKNAAIYDMGGVIDADGAFAGETYANEWDVFEFTADQDGELNIMTSGESGRTYNYALYDAAGDEVDMTATLQANETYFLAVQVETAGFNKEEDKGKFSGVITIA